MKQVGSGLNILPHHLQLLFMGSLAKGFYKLDGNGNLMWCLNFSVPPNPLTMNQHSWVVWPSAEIAYLSRNINVLHRLL